MVYERSGVTPGAARLHQLAREADLDLDEALVALWAAGLDYLNGPGDLISSRDITKARAALGLEGDRAKLTVAFWLERGQCSREELTDKLASVGIKLTPAARKIPKNSLRRLKFLFTPPDTPHDSQPAPKDGPEALPPLDWRIIGSVSDLDYLSEQELCAIHEALERDFADGHDAIQPPGVRDWSLLSSAVHRPRTAYSETLKYPTVEMAAAALFHSVVLNHAFHNGNKRTGLVALLAFLDRHGLVLTCTQYELFKFTLRVAQHSLVPAYADKIADREVLIITGWIKANSRRVERGERPMKWLRLKQRLRELGCETETATGVGNRLNIHREIEGKTFFGLRRTLQRLQTQVACSGDGTEADRNALHKIRRDLHLDDEHDMDSATFYAGSEVDSFIIEYRRILRKLAKL